MAIPGYLGLDIGGTGTKAGVFDKSGWCLGFGHAAYSPTTSAEGHVEIPIEQVYEAARQAARMAVGESGAEVRALAVSSQGQTFVSLDDHGRPLHPAIIWYDSRASKEAEFLRKAIAARNPQSPTPLVQAISTAPKIVWLRARHPELMSRARRHLLLPDYTSYRLTGEAVTDPSTAMTTGLYSDDAPGYSPDALKASEIDEAQVARIQKPGTPIGGVRSDTADEWGLSRDTLVVTGTNDQYAGALGAGNCRPGILSETTGTCLALVTLTEKLPERMPDGLIGGRFAIPQYQFALAYAKTAGLVLEWLNREFCPGASLQELDAMAAKIPIGSNGLTVLPHFDGMVSPKPNPDARGFICSLALNHTLADIYRATLESLSFSLRENIELLEKNGFEIEVTRSIGGGAKSDLWLQMKADVTGLPIERPSVTEAATMGAAMLASVGAGEFSSIAQASERLYRPAAVFEPDKHRSAQYEDPYARYRRLCASIYDL